MKIITVIKAEVGVGQGRVPGCPPPIASFIDYADNVLVPKVKGCNEDPAVSGDFVGSETSFGS